MGMGRTVDTDDLVDAQGVAEILGLAQRESVSLYQRRYPEMPRPAVDLGRGRPNLWSRTEVMAWFAGRSRSPQSSEESVASETMRTQLLDAAERVVARSPGDLSMRRLADEAGCSVGAAYRHFESKDHLIGALLQRIAERLASRTVEAGDNRRQLESLWGAMEENRAFEKLMAWSVLENRDVGPTMSRRPVVADVAADAVSRGAVDPVLVAGMTAFLGISLQSYEGLVNLAMDRPLRDERLRDAVLDMFCAWTGTQFPSSALAER